LIRFNNFIDNQLKMLSIGYSRVVITELSGVLLFVTLGNHLFANDYKLLLNQSHHACEQIRRYRLNAIGLRKALLAWEG
jgi:hypothetical protein